MSEETDNEAKTIIIKTTVTHTVTYFICGVTAFFLFNYSAGLSESPIMRPATDPIVKAAILFQPIRGLLFGIVFFLLRDILFKREKGWLITWIMLVFVGIFSTFGPAPGSIEGFIYLKDGLIKTPGGIIEILVQSFLLSFISYYWVNNPEKKWLNWFIGSLFVIVLTLSILSLLA